MRSPFPGMDPWLEGHWRDVHTKLMVYACDALEEQLPHDLFPRVEEGLSVDYGEDRRSIAPDIRVVETPEARGWPLAPAASATAVAEPMRIALDEPETVRHIEILDASTENRLVTAIEFLSPTNKDPFGGRPQYLQKQEEYLAAGANLVEIDLIRGGMFSLAFPPAKIPKRRRTPYYVCIRRATDPQIADVVLVGLRAPLPTIPIPLRPADRDVSLDLQSLIDQCYAKGRYAATIDYSEPLDAPLTGEDARWTEALLREAGRIT